MPVIAFAPGAGWALEEIALATGADVLGIDWQTEAAAARRRAGAVSGGAAGQPRSLLAVRDRRRRSGGEPTHMLAAFGGRGHIANLGHGILPDVPPAHARAFVDAVKEWRS